jgi:hypothetical protein
VVLDLVHEAEVKLAVRALMHVKVITHAVSKRLAAGKLQSPSSGGEWSSTAHQIGAPLGIKPESTNLCPC